MSQTTDPRKATPDPKLDEATFKQRFLQPYRDPAFHGLKAELDRKGHQVSAKISRMLTSIEMVAVTGLDPYIGCSKPYASHEGTRSGSGDSEGGAQYKA